MSALVKAGNAGAVLPRPGIRFGRQPEKSPRRDHWWLDLADHIGRKLSLAPRLAQADDRLAHSLRTADEALAQRRSDGLTVDHDRIEVTQRLWKEGFSVEAFAIAQALASEAVEACLGMVPYPTQRCAAFHLLHSRLVELDTGEGKSVALLLAAAVAGLAGVPTHVITANDALSQRDGERAKAVLQRLGLRVAVVTEGMEPEARRAAYDCHVVYSTPYQIGFDYLRDRHVGKADTIMRGLCLALIDEADSVLLDHARTPLVLGSEVEGRWDAAIVERARQLAATLEERQDFHVDKGGRRAMLTPECAARLERHFAGCSGALRDTRLLAELLEQSLTARHLLKRDADYLVDGDEVVLIDASSGRLLPNTRLTGGLHAAVCAKEGLPPPPETRNAGQITLHNLFARYCLVGGISGTLVESRFQLWAFHRLTVHRVAPRLASRRRHFGQRLYGTRANQQSALVASVTAAIDAGRPVLVGTDTVAAAEGLSQALERAGIAHALLTARDEAAEAHLVASAGRPGTVTVCTHIAGRGTDIALAPESLASGGLHVICCTCHGSARIERQLYGRSARNGQPGSSEALLCAADPCFVNSLPSWALKLACRFADLEGKLPSPLCRALVRLVGVRSELADAFQRWALLRLERHDAQRLTYTNVE